MNNTKYDIYVKETECDDWDLYASNCDEKQMKENTLKAKQNHKEIKVIRRKIVVEEEDIFILWRNGYYKR